VKRSIIQHSAPLGFPLLHPKEKYRSYLILIPYVICKTVSIRRAIAHFSENQKGASTRLGQCRPPKVMTLTANTSPHSIPEIYGYAIVERLYLGSRTAVYRAIQVLSQRPVVIKVLRRDYPSFGELVQFRNQYAIAKNLPIPGIVQPLSLEPWGSGYALVMEDDGDVALGKYVQQQQLVLTDVLAIAIQVADILHDLAQHRVVHKDIKPANILIHPDTKQVKLIDFSIASLLPKETQEIQSPNILEGTLAYLAPEQTGRMNRGIDYRADFYALGVTLYQLLTGILPFASSDPLELMHCHIAKVPAPVDQVNSDVPAMIAKIVTKLMAKNAEDRYQSALGLKHDLQECLTQWNEIGEIETFELGARDLSDRFLIPEKLYGRQSEVAILLDAFDRVSAGASELMLVAGFSGIGKTAVVNEVHKPITRQQGYFIKGKFDQFNRNIPLSAFVQALRDLMGQLLSESDVQLAQWQAQILTAVGENGQVLIDVIPELEQVIGKQPIATELSGSAAQNRFNLLFQKFIEVFTTVEHPLVLFLDDLQWADLASLQLIKLLMSDNGYLLMLGAYRDNEVSPVHPFILTVELIKKTGAIVNTITLAPLTLNDTNDLVADTLHCSTELAQPLTELIDRKTQGNPFFTTQFLKALHHDGQITFDRDRRYWECDIAEVNTLAITDDVVEFMALQLQKLPAATQQVLKLAACVGNQFDLATLAIVSEQSPTDAATALWKALQEGLILPTSQVYKFFQDLEQVDTQNAVNPNYRFLHDRVQQAAYFLIPQTERAIAHYQIGQLLLQQISPADQEERIFELVNQLNYGISVITDRAERNDLAQRNLMAGRKARSATAYQSANEYAAIGLQLLGTEAWQCQYDLTLTLHELAAEAAFLSGEFEMMDRWIESVLQSAQTPLEQINVYEVRIQALVSQNKLEQAINVGQSVLKMLGVSLPDNLKHSNIQQEIQQEIQAITALVGERSIEELFDIPKMVDVQQIQILRVSISILPAAFITQSPLHHLITLLQVKISVQFGNSPAAAVSYANYAFLISCILQDIELADQFNRLAHRLTLEPAAKSFRADASISIAILNYHRTTHLQETLPILQEAYQIGIETGTLFAAGYSGYFFCWHSFWCGQPLSELESQISAYAQQLKAINQITISSSCLSDLETTHILLSQTEEPKLQTELNTHEENRVSEQLATGDFFGLFRSYLYRLTISFLLGEIAHADQQATQVRTYLVSGKGTTGEAVFYFYDSLTALAIITQATSDEVEAQQQRVQTNQAQLQHWAYHAPMNYLHKWQLVEAEYNRVFDNKLEAIDLYDRAIAGAKANGYIQEEALANELAAKFYLSWGKEKIAQDYLINAYYGYAHWGAKAKVQDLERHYPQLLAPILQQQQLSLSATETVFATTTLTLSQAHGTQSSSSSSTSISATLDLVTVLKASQTLSSEIQLDKLLATLLHTVIENAGADKGVLLMPHENHWFVKAVTTVDQPARVESIALSSSSEVPHSLIHSIKRSLQSVVILDATAHPTLATDPYVVKQQPKSLLCTPILNQGKLVAILYLENRITVGAFTSDRVELLNLLCAQAAICLRNAQLYQDLQHSESSEREKAEELEQALAALQLTNHILAFRAEVDAALTRTDSLSNMLHSCTETVVQYLGAAFARIWTLNAHENVLELQASAGLYTHLDGPHARVPVGQFKIGLIAQERCPHLTNDVLNDSRVSNKVWAKQEGMIAFAGYPLMIDDQLVGVIAMFARQELSDELLDRLRLVSDEIASGIKRKQVEQALQASENQLQQKAGQLEQAFQQLQQSQLQIVQSEKMASLGNLVAGVAHEINNPIGFLNGSINNAKDYVQDLLEYLALYQQYHPNPATPVQDKAEDIDLEFLSEDLPKLLASMKGATDRIKGISTSLRIFSRADTEHKVRANLHEGIDSTLLILKYRLKANESRPAIEVIQNYSNLSEILCFPGQLNQVFMNILANAIDMFDELAQTRSFNEIKANPQQIIITTTIFEQQVEIRIADSGKGMLEEVKQKIFDHLFTTKSVGKGTGLGLAIARQIVVKKHGGSLEVQSELDRGTEFFIRLPIAD
jgi:predicted ATPase/signal transduction histidine kinase